MKGHDVIVYDKDTQVGGQLNIASVPPRKEEMNRAIHYLANEVKALGVDLRLGKAVTSEDIFSRSA